MLRTAFAFVLSAWPAALIESVLIAISPSAHQGVFAHPLSTFVAMCLIFYLFEIFLGIPAVILLRRKKLASLRAYALAGLGVIGTPIALLIFVTAIRQALPGRTWAYALSYFAVAGLLAGATFWTVSRPDRRPRSAAEIFK